MKYYEMQINKTCMSVGSREEEGWRRYDHCTIKFNDLAGIKTFLKNEYGTCKREKMYRNPDTRHVGYIFCFKSPGVQGQPQGYYERHWIEILEINAKTVLVRG